MLKINHLHKYYYRKKENEIHVLNDINFEFKDKGLYVLLGPSGSGKSTLLNTIGMLDSFDEGEIVIEDKIIKKYKNVDDIRNLYFGYVFQNYLLNEELSVFENLDIVLKLINYQGDHYKRIEDTLKTLEMEKYIKRKAKDLSGGQKQRIGIARCLIKSPRIILMDEPTGNLDEKNSIQVMEIASKLANECLVIMVSHNEDIATAYADYIVRIKDGQIKDSYENINKHHLSVNDANHIYLKDYDYQDYGNIEVYKNTEMPSLKVIVDHNKVYIKGTSNIEVINEDSSIKLINEHKKKEEKVEINLDLEKIDLKESKHVFKEKDLLKDAFKMKHKKYKTMAFFITSFIFALSIPAFSSLNSIDINEVIDTHTNLYEPQSTLTVGETKALLNENDLIYQSYNSLNLTYIEPPSNIDTNMSNVYLNASYVPYEGNYNFVYGEESESIFDIYVDKIIAKRLVNREDYQKLGFSEMKDLLNQEVVYTSFGFKGKVAGIVDTKEPSIYVNKQMLLSNEDYAPISYSYMYNNSLEPLNDNEYYVNEKYKEEDHGDKVIKGYFTSPYDVKYITSDKTYFDKHFYSFDNFVLYTKDIERYNKALNTEFVSNRDVAIEEYYTNKNITIVTSVGIIVITLSISLLFLYFIMASSLIHRIKEIGINRSIGVKKHDIYKIFLNEILAISLEYSLPGYLLSVIAGFYLHKGGLIASYSLWMAPLGFIIYLLFALVIGLIPVMKLMKKTPSEINKKYDI